MSSPSPKEKISKKAAAAEADEVVEREENDAEGESSPPPAKKQKGSKGKAVESSDAKPKRGLSSYILYSNDIRESLKKEGFEGKEIMKEAGKRWKAADEKEQQKYKDLAAEQKKKQDKAIAEWEKTHLDEEEAAKTTRTAGGSKKVAAKKK